MYTMTVPIVGTACQHPEIDPYPDNETQWLEKHDSTIKFVFRVGKRGGNDVEGNRRCGEPQEHVMENRRKRDPVFDGSPISLSPGI